MSVSAPYAVVLTSRQCACEAVGPDGAPATQVLRWSGAGTAWREEVDFGVIPTDRISRPRARRRDQLEQLRSHQRLEQGGDFIGDGGGCQFSATLSGRVATASAAAVAAVRPS